MLLFLLYLNTLTLLHQLEYLDLEALYFLNGNLSAGLVPVLRLLTETAYPACALFTAGLLLRGYMQTRPESVLAAAQVVLTLLLAAALIGFLKYSVLRPRPFVAHEQVQPRAPADSPSFPSGHTGLSFAAAMAIVLALRNQPLRLLVVAWALLIAYSRVALGVHYPSDVLASLLLATLAAILAQLIIIKNRGRLHTLLQRTPPFS